MNGNNIRLQNLRDFTVQIRNEADQIVGTGIAVSTDGKIVTCAHVVQAAVGAHPREVNSAEVGVYFPQVRGGEEKKRRAKVDCCFHEYDDDMVLLQLLEGASPLAPEQIAVLGMADQSEGNPFRTYGYSPIGNYPATRGDGIILGTIERPINRNLQVDPVQLKSRDIAEGMSGAAVLDVTRNLVIGLVMERFYSAHAVQDDIGYGVDSKVLTFDPFDFVLRGEALELKPAPELRLDKDLHQQAIEIVNYVRAHRKPADNYSWNSAPTVLPEWTGRDDLLAKITEDWNNPQKHVTGLVGFGGEGKSSLARKWVDNVCGGDPLGHPHGDSAPDGVFWWGFYENRSIDELLESALNFLSGGWIDPRQVPSSSLRAQIIGAMLGAGRYLFVLDGLEVLQHQDGDQYGLLTSNDLRDLLTYFARPDNASFCLITSRAPVLDLMDYTTYIHRDVERLSEADGVALLEKLGVKGSKEQEVKVVHDWDGHALTISLLGSYLAEKYNGDIAHLADIPVPTADEPRFERVHRVLMRYDEHLSESERKIMKLFSAFRISVHEDVFQKILEPLITSSFLLRKKKVEINKYLSSDPRFLELISRLIRYRILRYDQTSKTYTTHLLIRNYYHSNSAQEKNVHNLIKDYYLSIANNISEHPTFDNIKPLIEAVHHACQAGMYDEAWKIYWDRIRQGTRRVTIYQLGAYETEIALIKEFFPSNDTFQMPLVTDYGSQRFLINAVGFCLMNLGRLREAVPFFERYIEGNIAAQDWSNASIGYQNLAGLHIQLGTLETSTEVAQQALDLARKTKNNRNAILSLAHSGNAHYLLGDLEKANDNFQEAEKLEQERYLYGWVGVLHTEYLIRAKDLSYANSVATANLELCKRNNWISHNSMCHRVLGDLDFDKGDCASASEHYESALKIARGISVRDVLIQALLARGRFSAKHHKDLTGFQNLSGLEQAFSDLNEALGYCGESGYRIYEVDVRVALAWAYLANGEKEKARQSAERALQMSNEMGYHWGKVDAEEVLEKIGTGG